VFSCGSRAWIEPLLAGLVELLPWLGQWQNAPDPAYGGERMGSYFRDVIPPDALASQGLMLEKVQAWQPAGPPARRKRAKR
jgi:hypothetical protein